MRDLIERIATKTVDKKRPEVRIGHVNNFDSGRQLAWIKFPGDDELVKVRVALNMLPTRTIASNGEASADIVRVAGKPGAYYITDFVRGVPQDPNNIPLTGEIKMWPGATAPEGYLLCDGTVYNNVDYPSLAGLLGNTWGGVAGTSFAVPDFRRRFPWGVGSGVALGFSDTETVVSNRNPQHSHTIPNHTHTDNFSIASFSHVVNDTNQNAGDTNRLQGPASHTHTINGAVTSSGGGGATSTSAIPTSSGVTGFPNIAVNFIIKT